MINQLKIYRCPKKKVTVSIPNQDALKHENGKENGSSLSSSSSGSKRSLNKSADNTNKEKIKEDEKSVKINGTNGLNGTNGTIKDGAKENSKNDSEDSSNGSNRKNKSTRKDLTSTNFDEDVIYSRDNKKVSQEDFELMTVVGKGSFGKVMQVRKKDDDKIYAMKVLRKEAIVARKQVAHTMAERNILKKIHHPFIVSLHYAFQTDEKLYMILDYVNGGELFFHLKKEGKFSEARVRFYVAEISAALQHLHSLDIVYRDLKPENILLDADGHIRITDFGLSKEINPDEGTVTFCGTPEYLAPEVLKGQPHGTAVDWWSLGTLMYEMLTGLPPYYSQNVNIMYQKILTADLRFPNFMSPESQDILEGFLRRDPEKRLGTSPDPSILRNHAFFKGLDWEKLLKREVVPPFKPKVKSDNDITQIDPVFTQEAAIDSVVDSKLANIPSDTFENFTFTNQTVMDD